MTSRSVSSTWHGLARCSRSITVVTAARRSSPRPTGTRLLGWPPTLIAFVDNEIGAPIDLLGHSMGGAISLQVTLSRPDLVRSLILMDTSAWSFLPPDPEMAAFMAQFMASYDPAGGLPEIPAGMSPEAELIAAATPPEWQVIKAQMDAQFDPYALQALGRELFDRDSTWVRASLGEIAGPVSVIVGEHDHPFVDQAGELSAVVADGHLTVFPGAYHSPQLTHQGDWLAAVEAHLARVSSR